MLQRNFRLDVGPDPGWESLLEGIPTVNGFARLSSAALARLDPPPAPSTVLSPEARTILYAARQRGTIELRGNKNAFEPADRLLAVCVLVDEDRRLVFKNKSQPRQTVAFLEGFRQLCAEALVMHHLLFDFSLSTRGFEIADQVGLAEVETLLAFATAERL